MGQLTRFRIAQKGGLLPIWTEGIYWPIERWASTLTSGLIEKLLIFGMYGTGWIGEHIAVFLESGIFSAKLIFHNVQILIVFSHSKSFKFQGRHFYINPQIGNNKST